ncbi:unnamed protein product [Brugia pahangi]|uniref:Annexin n=1 Tax=Brugia pahangi TaxID=6280 RepID=A0A0N4TZT2_BRUPA|nr:unnamed protein product [Brugia pahangi]
MHKYLYSLEFGIKYLFIHSIFILPIAIRVKYFNGPAKKALLALIQYARNSNSYFADLLNSSLKNPSETRDGDLIRLIISRSEIDLATISEAYMKSYKKKLIEDINKECNGSCRDCLITIIKGNTQNSILN